MNTLSFKNMSLATVIMMASAIIGCGADDTNPMKGYDKGVLPYDFKVQDQVRVECGFSFTAGAFEVVEGETFKQTITVVGNYSGGDLALQGEPKGMSIKKNVITYAVPRGIVPKNSPSINFVYNVLPRSQIGKSVQCSSKFSGVVTVKTPPQVTIKNAPQEIDLDNDNAQKLNFTVSVKANSARGSLKSNENLKLDVDFDKNLDSKERPICDLSQTLTVATASLPVSANERMYSIEIDTTKMQEVIAKKFAKKPTQTQFICLAVITGKNEENKTSYSKNLVIKVNRKAGQ